MNEEAAPTTPRSSTSRVGAPKGNPLLSRRMVNAHARLSGCGEFDPDAPCEHRFASRRTMEMLMEAYESEMP
jgi:hypothetical protein